MATVDIAKYKRIVQGLFDPEPRNDDISGSAIWCLGAEYPSRPSRNGTNNSSSPIGGHTPCIMPDKTATDKLKEDASPGELSKVTGLKEGDEAGRETPDITWPTEFLDDCESRIWFTYRSSFPPIVKSPDATMTLAVRFRSLADKQGFSSDTGWGCMIRSGQCLLANALSVLRLGREWRRGTRHEEEKQLLSQFADDPSAPFSIHKFVEHGARACGKHPGEWFGPSATARCIQALSNADPLSGLKVYVNGDGADVYEDTFLSIAGSDTGKFTPVLILVGVRLGIDRITPAYWDALKASLELPQSIGIAGGRPSSSHYFFAHQGDQIFYLDPHFTRPALPFRLDPARYTAEEVESSHTRRLRRLHLKDMDPSMLLGFLIRDRTDWDRWREALKTLPSKPVVHIADKEPILYEQGVERPSALAEVETLDDEAEEDDHGEMIEHPSS
ncbi:uncharacterized protein KY384_005899 [Bacidia gigantensis]|uniref:uncharacterized protein n=1 Tax=Bacidia gigantensis TaxID=2732470 RepID=UPI001D040801|nr:uncharacterized protein KY384_005899 [Bacidia gigantensis]KAG8529264.1 hypothetical protein KY384_005899 [Bacidia gigantensis]